VVFEFLARNERIQAQYQEEQPNNYVDELSRHGPIVDLIRANPANPRSSACDFIFHARAPLARRG
jgi:hypothetical protein